MVPLPNYWGRHGSKSWIVKLRPGSSACRVINDGRERSGIAAKLITALSRSGLGRGVGYGGVVALAVLEGGLSRAELNENTL